MNVILVSLQLLEGHLHLVKVLVDVLDKRIIGVDKSQQGRGLIQLVCFYVAGILICILTIEFLLMVAIIFFSGY